MAKRTISVSTEVFARIWSLRHSGEDTEDEILRRVLERIPFEPAMRGLAVDCRPGFYDQRFGLSFDEGFEIFRNYQGTEFRAKATSGKWLLNNDQTAHTSLNLLSRAIGAKNENAWANWFYSDPDRGRRPLSDLRDPVRIVRRKRTEGSEIALPSRECAHTREGQEINLITSGSTGVTWFDDVYQAVRRINRKASLGEIYLAVKHIRQSAGRSMPPSYEAIVRRTLEESSSDSLSFKGRADVFCMPDGHGAGVWALR